MFRALKPRSVRWRALSGNGQGEGLTHVSLTKSGGQIMADGMAIGSINGAPFASRFVVSCDLKWRTRLVAVSTTGGVSLVLHSDGKGKWRNEDGERIRELDGCVDVDLQASPYTNTLPIRRLALSEQTGTVELKMAYVPFDTFQPAAHQQRYTCLEDGRRYLYENGDGPFRAELSVDEDGLVVDYPGLFERVAL